MLNKKKYENKIDCAIVGLGRISWILELDKKRPHPCTHFGAIYQDKSLFVESVCDIDDLKCQKFYQYSKCKNIRFFHSSIEMFKNSQAQILIVACDSYLHIEMIKNALKYMKNLKSIVCEKPLSINLEDSLSIEEELQHKKISFYVNHSRRWQPNYRKVKHIIKNERLGKLSLINACIFAGGQKINGEGPILHDGTHLIDIIEFFTESMPKSFYSNIEWKEEVENRVNVFYKTENKIDVNINISSDKRFFFFELDLFFEKGRIIIGNDRFEIYKASPSEKYEGFIDLSKVNIKEVLENDNFPAFNFYNNLYNEVRDDIINENVNNKSYYSTVNVQKIIHRIIEERND